MRQVQLGTCKLKRLLDIRTVAHVRLVLVAICKHLPNTVAPGLFYTKWKAVCRLEDTMKYVKLCWKTNWLSTHEQAAVL